MPVECYPSSTVGGGEAPDKRNGRLDWRRMPGCQLLGKRSGGVDAFENSAPEEDRGVGGGLSNPTHALLAEKNEEIAALRIRLKEAESVLEHPESEWAAGCEYGHEQSCAQVEKLEGALESIVETFSDRERFVMLGSRAFMQVEQVAREALKGNE